MSFFSIAAPLIWTACVKVSGLFHGSIKLYYICLISYSGTHVSRPRKVEITKHYTSTERAALSSRKTCCFASFEGSPDSLEASGSYQHGLREFQNAYHLIQRSLCVSVDARQAHSEQRKSRGRSWYSLCVYQTLEAPVRAFQRSFSLRWKKLQVRSGRSFHVNRGILAN